MVAPSARGVRFGKIHLAPVTTLGLFLFTYEIAARLETFLNYVGYDDVATTLIVILAACAAIAVVWGAVKAIREILKPLRDAIAKVDEHDQKLLEDFKRMEDLKHANELQMMALLQLINHSIDGNDVDKLTAVRDKLQLYLASR